MSAAPNPGSAWNGPYGPPGAYGSAPPPARPNDSVGKWLSIGGAFIATAGTAVATGIQAMAGLIGLAYDTYQPEPTPTNEFFGKVFLVLWGSTFLSGLLTVVALVLAIVAASIGSAKLTIWVYIIFALVSASCILTWISGFASIPG